MRFVPNVDIAIIKTSKNIIEQMNNQVQLFLCTYDLTDDNTILHLYFDLYIPRNKEIRKTIKEEQQSLHACALLSLHAWTPPPNHPSHPSCMRSKKPTSQEPDNFVLAKLTRGVTWWGQRLAPRWAKQSYRNRRTASGLRTAQRPVVRRTDSLHVHL